MMFLKNKKLLCVASLLVFLGVRLCTKPKTETIALDANSRTKVHGDEDRDEVFWEQTQKRMRRRKQRVKDECRKMGIERDLRPNTTLMISEKYKLAYCFLPKSGSSNMKRVMLALEGYGNDTSKIFPRDRNPHEVHWEANKLSRVVEEKPQGYITFMLVRHPYERVLSAYRDKLAPQNSARLPSYYRLSIDINRRFGHPSPGEATLAYFEQFVDYLHETHDTSRKSRENHWNSATFVCNPCQHDYDVIMKLETIRDDFRYLMMLAGSQYLTLPSGYSEKSGSAVVNLQEAIDVIKRLPHNRQRYLQQVYDSDFRLFEYNANLK